MDYLGYQLAILIAWLHRRLATYYQINQQLSTIAQLDQSTSLLNLVSRVRAPLVLFAGYSSVWIERTVRDREASGSNPLTSIVGR